MLNLTIEDDVCKISVKYPLYVWYMQHMICILNDVIPQIFNCSFSLAYDITLQTHIKVDKSWIKDLKENLIEK